MNLEIQPKLQFQSFQVLDCGFLLYKSFQPDINIEVSLNILVRYSIHPDDKKKIYIVFEAEIEGKEHYKIIVRAIGKFLTSEDLDQENKKIFLSGNAPAIVFPYFRSFISTFSINLGSSTPLIVLPTYIFKGEIEAIPFEPCFE